MKNNIEYLISREDRNMAFDLNDEELQATRDSNGANICVGDYVRTDKGKIAKIKEIRLGKYKNLDEFINMYMFDNENWTTDRYILKHSKNIIDLIEVGDYVNGCLVTAIYDEYKNDNSIQFETNYEGRYRYYSNEEIKSILTKEQYNANCYRLEE